MLAFVIPRSAIRRGLALSVAAHLASALIARHGFRRLVWPMALTMHAPNLLFWWAASAHPSKAALFAVVGAATPTLPRS